jgi:LAGLIDADG endonuclease
MRPHGFKESIYHRVVPSFKFSRNIKESVLMELLASYFDTNSYLRYKKDRVDVNVYGLYKLEFIVNLFKSFPLSNSKQKEFII